MYFASKTDKGYEIFSRRMNDDVVRQFIYEYRKELEKKIDAEEEPFDETEGYETDKVYLLEAKDFAGLRKVMETSDDSTDTERKVNFTFIKFKNRNQEEVITFRYYYQNKFLHKDKKKFLLFTEKEVKFVDSDLVAVDETIDCILFKDKFVILAVNSFERMYDLKGHYRQYSDQVFTHLESQTDYNIKNIAEWKDKCGSTLWALKKMKILSDIGAYTKMTLDIVKKFNDKYDLGITIEGNEIDFPSISSFFKLYEDENEYTSQLTNVKYESIAKKRIG